MTNDSQWNALVATHSDSLSRYIDIAADLDESAWTKPVGEGKWSPMEITEHLRAAYEVLIREQDTGVGLRPRGGIFLRTFLRLFALPYIMRNRRLPAGAKSPTEIRPDDCIEDRTEALKQLRDFGERFEAKLTAKIENPQAKMTHHLFGDFTPAKGLEFVTIHLENHTRQLPAEHE